MTTLAARPSRRTRTASHSLAARELPPWLVRDLIRWASWIGFVGSAIIGVVSVFGDRAVIVPSALMLVAAVVFAAAIRAHDDGMMLLRALGIFVIAAITRAVTLIAFQESLPFNNAVVAFVLWSGLAFAAAMLIRALILWGIVVRPPKHRW